MINSEPAGVFDKASVDAASKWIISPAMKDGKPVEGWVRVPLEFVPDSKESKPVPVSPEKASG